MKILGYQARDLREKETKVTCEVSIIKSVSAYFGTQCFDLSSRTSKELSFFSYNTFSKQIHYEHFSKKLWIYNKSYEKVQKHFGKPSEIHFGMKKGLFSLS